MWENQVNPFGQVQTLAFLAAVHGPELIHPWTGSTNDITGFYFKGISSDPVCGHDPGHLPFPVVEEFPYLRIIQGTGKQARVANYRVAGKTGTARKTENGGYSTERYTALFAGLAPASKPRLAMVVVVNEPSAGKYYGGSVAAPVFARVMSGAMRLLNVAPDDVSEGSLLMAAQQEGGR